MPTRIILADDHSIMRAGLAKILKDEEDIEVIAQTEDGQETVEKVRELLPDIVIMDIRMPNLNGIEATRQIVKDHPKVKIIALSMHSGKKFVVEMLKAGACGYLLKDCAADELTTAIRSVIENNNYLSPAITDVVIDDYVKGDSRPGESAFSVLTQREREVLQLLSEGNTTKQIALQLYISPKTVEAHRLRIMKKLDIDNIAKLTKYAIQEGLTSPEP